MEAVIRQREEKTRCRRYGNFPVSFLSRGDGSPEVHIPPNINMIWPIIAIPKFLVPSFVLLRFSIAVNRYHDHSNSYKDTERPMWLPERCVHPVDVPADTKDHEDDPDSTNIGTGAMDVGKESPSTNSSRHS
ncbi:hypothetical protein STEG23_004052 [Scotinomys teguina]